MEILHKKVLQTNHTQLVNDLDLVRSNVLDSLREDGLISSNEEEIILSERTKRNQNTKLLNFLKKRDPAKQPYDKFKRALQSDYSFIVERLKNSEKKLNNLAKTSHSKKCTHCVLSKNLIPPDVTHSLYENGVLTDDDLEELNNDNLPRQDRVKRLLELLKSKPDQSDTLDQFSRCLETKYNYLVQKDNNKGLEAYLKCSCKDSNVHNAVDVNANKENVSSVANGDNSNCDRCVSIDDNNYEPENGLNKLSRLNGVTNSSVLQTLHENVSSGTTRSACESSWTGDCRSCELSASETQTGESIHHEDFDKLKSIDSDEQMVLNEQKLNLSNQHAGLNINDLSKSHNDDHSSHFPPGSFYNVKCENKYRENDYQSGDDNTINTAEIGRTHSRSICEDSWVESTDENPQQHNDTVDTKGEYNCSANDTMRSLDMTELSFDRSTEFTVPFGNCTLSVDAIVGLASKMHMNGEHRDLVGNMSMPFNVRPPLCRLSSSESFSGIPVISGQFPIGNGDLETHTFNREKSKRRVRRKRMKSVHEVHEVQTTQMDIAFDDVDGNAGEEKDDKQNDQEDKLKVNGEYKPVEEEEDNDRPESPSPEGACSILKPVFRASPNNKKLMKRCSKLWDQLFFLRETGDWDTFSIVTQKAFDKFGNCPDIQVLLYRSEMCVSTFYKNDPAKALEMFEKAIEELPKTEMPNWHLARILPLKVELCTRAKMFEEASNLLEDAKQAMMSLGPCLSTGAVYFFEAIYLGTILQCTRSDTKSAEGITEQVKTCFLTAIEHYQQEEIFAIKSFLNQVYLFLALFSLGVDFKKITYIQVRDIKREDISLAGHYLNLFENNCWGHSTNWSRMLFYIGRGEQHKLMNNMERSLDYFKQAQLCCNSGKFAEHVAFIESNIDIVSEKLEEKLRLKALRSEQSADDILKKVLESSSSESGS